jgi:uncharacterized membrane protein
MGPMAFLKFLMLLALIVWIGGIIFFAMVEAPALFAVLPSREMAGNVVSRSLAALHWMGIVSGVVFLLCSLLYNRLRHAQPKPLAAGHILVLLMLLLTAISQFAITPRMRALRAEMKVIDNLPWNDPRRLEFDRLHSWSTRLEGGVLLLGVAVVGWTAKK